MSERQEAAAWLRGKAAKKILSELYGEAAFRTQAERYARLADLTDDDAPASELRFYSAPGRTELGGNHTDHNKGRVLCAAVRLDAVACATPVKGLRVSLRSEGYADPIVVDLSDLEPRAKERGKTEALVRGVAKALSLRGVEPRGFVGRIHSEVLRGSGLSSSAAVEVLLGAIMADMAGVEISAIELAKAGQFAENEYFGKPCGLMDQTASAVGGVVAIDFADPTAPKVKRVDFDFEDEGYCLAVVDTGGSHADLTSDYAAIPTEMKAVAAVLGAGALREIDPELLISRGPEIRRSCGDRALLRALHFVAENARVPDMVDALKAGDMAAYLKLVKKSGDSSWKLLQNLYPPSDPAEQGLAVALALSADFLGKKGAARVHGGGFAGTIQAYVPMKLLPEYAGLMERFFGSGSVIPIAVRHAGAIRVF